MAVETPLKGNIGDSIKRKEDDRFIRGRGNYLDDIVLPGMLHMAINRSPLPTPGSSPSTLMPPRRSPAWSRS